MGVEGDISKCTASVRGPSPLLEVEIQDQRRHAVLPVGTLGRRFSGIVSGVHCVVLSRLRVHEVEASHHGGPLSPFLLCLASLCDQRCHRAGHLSVHHRQPRCACL